jgi:hypothetical protein
MPCVLFFCKNSSFLPIHHKKQEWIFFENRAPLSENAKPFCAQVVRKTVGQKAKKKEKR